MPPSLPGPYGPRPGRAAHPASAAGTGPPQGVRNLSISLIVRPMRRALGLLVVAALLLGAVVYVVIGRDGRLPIELPGSRTCQARTASGSVSLAPEQMANAATITATGVIMGIPDRGIVIALATAMQESDLYNLSYGDRDSLGLFQQRPSQGWGTAEQVQDPRYAARAFYNQLLRVPGWEQMRLTDAAQAVQRSAFPEAYQKWESDAQVLGEALLGAHVTAVTCTRAGEPALRGAAATEALAAGLAADWGVVAPAVADPASGSLSVTAVHDRGGWQLAHWLVAHSTNHSLSRVRYGGHEWTVDSGEWTQVETSVAAAPDVVVAQVHPA
jgi:hypothetical protein